VGVCDKLNRYDVARCAHAIRILSRRDNSNNSHDNVYGAVIMSEVIARVHPVQTERRVAANPQTKTVDLGCESAENWQLSSTIAIVIITQPVG